MPGNFQGSVAISARVKIDSNLLGATPLLSIQMCSESAGKDIAGIVVELVCLPLDHKWCTVCPFQGVVSRRE